jgi:nucleotide-binding universal stress UspA family protein
MTADGAHKILVAIDFTPASDAALAQAVALARPLEAEIVLLHVWEPPAPIGLPGLMMPEPSTDFTARAELAAEADSLRGVGVNVRTVLGAGAAASEILRTAAEEKPDLLVMGTHGRRGLSRIALGSVAEHVIREAACPVLTLRASTRD